MVGEILLGGRAGLGDFTTGGGDFVFVEESFVAIFVFIRGFTLPAEEQLDLDPTPLVEETEEACLLPALAGVTVRELTGVFLPLDELLLGALVGVLTIKRLRGGVVFTTGLILLGVDLVVFLTTTAGVLTPAALSFVGGVLREGRGAFLTGGVIPGDFHNDAILLTTLGLGSGARRLWVTVVLCVGE